MSALTSSFTGAALQCKAARGQRKVSVSPTPAALDSARPVWARTALLLWRNQAEKGDMCTTRAVLSNARALLRGAFANTADQLGLPAPRAGRIGMLAAINDGVQHA